jgi:hypothetical protein
MRLQECKAIHLQGEGRAPKWGYFGEGKNKEYIYEIAI